MGLEPDGNYGWCATLRNSQRDSNSLASLCATHLRVVNEERKRWNKTEIGKGEEEEEKGVCLRIVNGQ